MPYARGLETIGDDIVYDSGDYAGLLDKALERFGWDAMRRELARRRGAGEAVGAGLAFFVEKSGLGPKDGVIASVDDSGAVEIVTGGASLGQGFETAMAQIAADGLGVDYRAIRVIHGQTERIDHGIGAHASRATVMTGSATAVAAKTLRGKLLEAASQWLQAPAAALDIVDGRAVRRDAPDGPSMALGGNRAAGGRRGK